MTKRSDLYDKVWAKIRAIAVDAAPGSITPATFARVAVDVVLSELLKAGEITPRFRDPSDGGT